MQQALPALHVPYTGIVDYKEVAVKYADIIVNRFGGEICYNSPVTGIDKKK